LKKFNASRQLIASPLDFFTQDTAQNTYKLPTIPFLNQVIADGVVSIDIETRDPGLIKSGPSNYRQDKNGYIIGVGIANAKHEWYLPVRHSDGPNLELENVLCLVKDISVAPDVTTVFQNGQYDLGWFRFPHGIYWKGKLADTMMMGALLDEWDTFNLDHMGERYLGVRKDDSDMYEAATLYGKLWTNHQGDSVKENQFERWVKENMWRFHPRYVDSYGKRDVRLTYDLYKYFLKLIKEEDLTQVYDLECEMIPLITDMTEQGIRIDLDQLDIVEKQIVGLGTQLQNELNQKLGFECKAKSNKDLKRAFQEQGVPFDSTAPSDKFPEGNGQFADKKLKEYAKYSNHWLPQLIINIRECETANSLYFTPYRDHFICPDGKIHPLYKSTKSEKFSGSGDDGTKSGRLACIKPNVQQIAGRTPQGKLIRTIFAPEKGTLWGCFDYSQQEPRINVHYSYLMKLRGAVEAVAYYQNPKADYHTMVLEMAGLEAIFGDFNKARDIAKIINLGLAYGMGDVKLCKSLGFPTVWEGNPPRERPGQQGKDLFALYHEKIPFVKLLSEVANERAQDRGFIRTMGGRKARFPFWESYKDRYNKNRQGPFKVRDYEEACELWGEYTSRKNYQTKQLERIKNIVRSDTRKASNRLIQGTAADMMKMALIRIRKEGIIPLTTVHDEADAIISHPDQISTIREIMLDTCRLVVPHKVDFECGPNWGKAKKPKSDEELSDLEHYNKQMETYFGTKV
jgi:DNA polymerase I-like protein with 3'-5' exonuclease and polymerase domains